VKFSSPPAKNRHLRTVAQICQAMSSQRRHISTIAKNLLNNNISSTCPHNMVNFGPPTAEIVWRVAPVQISTGFASWLRYTAATSLNGGQPNFARFFAISRAGTLYIQFWGSCPLTEFCQVRNSLCVQILRSPVLAALLDGTRAVGVSQTMQHGIRNGTMELSLLVIFNRGRHVYSEGGHHVGHRSTF